MIDFGVINPAVTISKDVHVNQSLDSTFYYLNANCQHSLCKWMYSNTNAKMRDLERIRKVMLYKEQVVTSITGYFKIRIMSRIANPKFFEVRLG